MVSADIAGPPFKVPSARAGWRFKQVRPGPALAVTFLAVLVVCGIAAPLVAPQDPLRQTLSAQLLGPGHQGHLLGTDELGRDLLSRLVWGIRPLGAVALVSVAMAAAFGFGWGVVAGTRRPSASTAMMRLADIELSVPPVIVAVLLAVALTPGRASATAAIALVTWPQYARLVRAETIRVRASDYVQLARVAGLSNIQLIRRHIVPNVLNSFVALCALNVGTAVIFASALSFLGVGVQAPTPDWGNMLSEGTQYLNSWWIVVMPGMAISLTVIAINVLGTQLRDRLDPRVHALRSGATMTEEAA